MQITRWGRIGVALAAAALTLAACGGSTRSSAPPTTAAGTRATTTTVAAKATTTVPTIPVTTVAPATTAAPTTAAPTTVAPTTVAPTTIVTSGSPPATTSAAGAAYASARSQWEQGAQAASSNQDPYLLTAANDLNAQASAAGFSDAVAELRDLASLPETGDSSAQQADAQSDIAALDQFFDTPGLDD